jgi:hypothetical protein
MTQHVTLKEMRAPSRNLHSQQLFQYSSEATCLPIRWLRGLLRADIANIALRACVQTNYQIFASSVYVRRRFLKCNPSPHWATRTI